MHKLKIIIGLTLTAALSFAITGCETEDDNKLASAQECLDKLRDSDADSVAQACAEKVAGLTSPASYLIRCSVDFFVGGVKATQIVAAYDGLQSAAEKDKAPILMVLLAQDSTAEAATTLSDCTKSEVPSLIYLATVSQLGTLFEFPTVANGGFNPADPDTFLDHCAAAPGNCDDTAIGSAVVGMYDIYCIGDAAENEVCSEINSAIVAGGGNYDAVATALYGLLDQ